jgi:RND family efflux transporter MFP subunit
MKRLWLAAALLFVAQAAHAESDTPAALVSTIRLALGRLPATVEAYGQVQAGPGAEMTVTLPAGGIVSALPVSLGQRVAAGDVLAVITPDAGSVAARHHAEDAVQAARASRAHVAALLASRLATRADLAAADQALADATATLAALNATGAGVARTVKAPRPGIVSAILAAQGGALPDGAALLRITGTDALVAVLGVTPAAAISVKPGDSARATILATGAVVAGQVTQMAGMVDPQTGLINVTLALPGAPLLGATVDAVITTGTLSGYIVPRDAVQTDEQGDYVFQVDPSGIAHRVGVHVLGGQGGMTILAPGLDAALPLVTAGAYQLDDGAAVRVAGP